MRYGHFDDETREYVITTPHTPAPWINYLGSQRFFSLISHLGGGYSFYRDARMRRLTRYRYNNIPADAGGRYFYVHDAGDVWTPTWLPVKADLDHFETRHGLGYTRITGERGGLRVEQLHFVPVDTDAEVARVTVTNTSPVAKSPTLFSFVEFALWNAQDDQTNYQRNLSIGEVEVEVDGPHGSAIYHRTEYRERRDHFAVHAVNAHAEGFDTDRDTFAGLYNGLGEAAVPRVGASAGSVASGWYPIGSLSVRPTLAPGESATYTFVLGYLENPADAKWADDAQQVVNKAPAHALLSRFATTEQTDAAFAELQRYWTELLSTYSVSSPDPRLDRMVNVWNQYQCMVTFNMSRSASYFETGIGRGMGFRDSTQDLLGLRAPGARAGPRADPGHRRDAAAGRVRLPPVPAADQAREPRPGLGLQRRPDVARRGRGGVPQGDRGPGRPGRAGAVRQRRRPRGAAVRAPERDPSGSWSSNLGPHGLPLIGRADWNDCLNLNCFSTEPGESFQTTENQAGGAAESVFIATQFVLYGEQYAQVAERHGQSRIAAAAREEVDRMRRAVLEHGWDGRWFLRAYDYYGHKVGTDEDTEGKIWIEPQGFAVMAGIGTDRTDDGPSVAETALESVHDLLATPHGMVLQYPAYTTYRIELGEVSSYPPGYKENGGIFCHNNPWVIIGETELGHGARAFDYYRRIAPAYREEISEVHRQEPYVYAQMIAGKEAVAARRGEELLAHRDRRVELRRRQPAPARCAAGLGRPRRRPADRPGRAGVHGAARGARGHLRDHGAQLRRRRRAGPADGGRRPGGRAYRALCSRRRRGTCGGGALSGRRGG